MTALTWSLFGLLATVVAGLLGLGGVGATWIRDGFRDLRGEIGGIRGEMTAGFRATNQRIDGTNARIDETNVRIDGTNARLDARIDGLTVEMHAGFAAVRGDIAALDRRLAAVEGG